MLAHWVILWCCVAIYSHLLWASRLQVVSSFIPPSYFWQPPIKNVNLVPSAVCRSFSLSRHRQKSEFFYFRVAVLAHGFPLALLHYGLLILPHQTWTVDILNSWKYFCLETFLFLLTMMDIVQISKFPTVFRSDVYSTLKSIILGFSYQCQLFCCLCCGQFYRFQ